MARALGALATGIAASRVAELAAVAFLGVFLAARFGARVRMPRW